LESHNEPARLFSGLAARFHREQNPQALEELLAFAKRKFPNEGVLRQYELDQLWEKQDYAGVIAFCAALPDKPDPNRYDRFASNRRERELLSHLMLGDTVQAWKLASEPPENIRQQWLVRLAEGNASAVRDFLNENGERLYSPLSLDEAASVPALAAFLNSDEFRRLRAELPMPFSFDYFPPRALIFYPETANWSDDSLRERLRQGGLAEWEVQKLAQPPLITNTFRLRSPSSAAYTLTFGDAPYVTAADLQNEGQHLGVAMRTAVASHRQWVSLSMESGSKKKEDEQAWLKIISALAPDAVAIWAWPPESEALSVVVTPDVAQQLGTNPEKLLTFTTPTGTSNWLPVTEDFDTERENSRWYARCRAVAQGGAPGRVQVRIERGRAREDQWLDVVAVRHEHWGNYAIDARLHYSSELKPLYRAGDLVRLESYEIRAWED
jgi:hypothetical protein